MSRKPATKYDLSAAQWTVGTLAEGIRHGTARPVTGDRFLTDAAARILTRHPGLSVEIDREILPASGQCYYKITVVSALDFWAQREADRKAAAEVAKTKRAESAKPRRAVAALNQPAAASSQCQRGFDL